MAGLTNFLKLYKDVDSVKSIANLGPLFESIVYLIENDMENDKTKSALSKVFKNYVEMQTDRIEVLGASAYSTSVKLDLTKVPQPVAEAINKRAKILKERLNNKEKNDEQEIINLLKVDDEELQR